ncbi:TIGR02391 family protein [Chloroflexota bacterium]
MIPFPDDLQAIDDLLRKRAGLDPDLAAVCQEHIDSEQYADAVFKAFRHLEARIKFLSGIEDKSAGNMIDLALRPGGPLVDKLGLSRSQAAAFGNLLRGAFGLFRNPEAHAIDPLFHYDSAECQTVLAFANLLLQVLDRRPEDPLESALKRIRGDIGSVATDRLADFLQRVLDLGLQADPGARLFAFKTWALRAPQEGRPLSRMRTTLFYLDPAEGKPCLNLPVDFWVQVVGPAAAPIVDRISDLGPVVTKWRWLRVSLRDRNDARTFGRLFDAISNMDQLMEGTLTAVNRES